MTLRPYVCALFALLLTLGTVRADTPPAVGAQRVSLGDGRTLTVSAPRQLTQNAHVGMFLVRPGSKNVAYTNTELKGETLTQNVRMVNIDTGNSTLLFSKTGPKEGDSRPPAHFLAHWSGDGRYLLMWSVDFHTMTNHPPYSGPAMWHSIDTGVSPAKVRPLPLPDNISDGLGGPDVLRPSPSGMLFFTTWRDPTQHDAFSNWYVYIYDPARNVARRLPQFQGPFLSGWTDDAHLLIGVYKTDGVQYYAHDILTGKDTPTTQKPAKPVPPASVLPGVTLSLTQTARDLPSMGKPSTVATAALYLHVTAGKCELPPLLLDGSLPSHDTQAVLAPNQSSAVWIQNGDLYTCTFAVVPATDADKAAAR